MLEQLKTVLENKGYTVRLFQTAQQAREYVLASVSPEQSVGIGGSISVQQLELDKELAAKGCPVYWHWTAPGPEKEAAQVSAATADVYLCSANAVTVKGQLINIDGHGNRVAATIHGPGKVIFLIGRNKIVEDYDAAMDRIKNTACPANARRLGLQTPCAALGYCTDCSSPQRMCNATVILERATSGHPMEVVLVDEDLGY